MTSKIHGPKRLYPGSADAQADCPLTLPSCHFDTRFLVIFAAWNKTTNTKPFFRILPLGLLKRRSVRRSVRRAPPRSRPASLQRPGGSGVSDPSYRRNHSLQATSLKRRIRKGPDDAVCATPLVLCAARSTCLRRSRPDLSGLTLRGCIELNRGKWLGEHRGVISRDPPPLAAAGRSLGSASALPDSPLSTYQYDH